MDDHQTITASFIADLLEGRRAAEVRRKPGRTIVRTTLADNAEGHRPVFLKIYAGNRRWTPVRWFLTSLVRDKSPAAVERRNLEWAAQRGIPVPRLVTTVDFSDAGLAFSSALITEELSGMRALHALIPMAAKSLPPTAFRKWKLGVTEEIARLTRLLHAAGRFHKDLYLCHFFLPQVALTDDLPVRGRLHLLDLLRLKHHRWSRKRWQVKDLAQLLYSSDLTGIGVRDRVHFIQAYLECRKLDRAGRLLLASVARKAERYRRQNRGRVTG